MNLCFCQEHGLYYTRLLSSIVPFLWNNTLEYTVNIKTLQKELSKFVNRFDAQQHTNLDTSIGYNNQRSKERPRNFPDLGQSSSEYPRIPGLASSFEIILEEG